MSNSTEKYDDEKLKAATELLSDPDDAVSSMALDTIIESGRAEETLAAIQDDHDANVRRHAHQLGSILHQQKLLDDLIHKYEQARLDILEAFLDVDLLYDPSSSEHFLRQLLDEFCESFRVFKPKEIGLGRVISFLARQDFYVPPLPWIAIEEYLLGDVLHGDGAAVPTVLAVLAQKLGSLIGLDTQVATCNGFVCIICNREACVFENGLQIKEIAADDEICVLNNQQIFRLYICQLLTSSMATWEVFDTHLFMEILNRLCGLKTNCLPTPFGSTPFPYDGQSHVNDKEEDKP